MARYGSPSGVFVFDGYNLLAHKLQGIRVKQMAITEPYTGVGDSWEENVPVGVQQAELAQEGAFFSDDTGTFHERLAGAAGSPDSDPNGTPGVGIVGYSGSAQGSAVYAFSGALGVSYDVVSSVNQLQRANVEYKVTGQMDNDAVLIAAARTTVTTDSNSTSVDNAAATDYGGRAYLNIDSLTLHTATNLVVTLQDSVNDSDWLTLASFAAATVVGSETVAVAAGVGSVAQYLRVLWAWTGGAGASSTAKITVAFRRDTA